MFSKIQCYLQHKEHRPSSQLYWYFISSEESYGCIPALDMCHISDMWFHNTIAAALQPVLLLIAVAIAWSCKWCLSLVVVNSLLWRAKHIVHNPRHSLITEWGGLSSDRLWLETITTHCLQISNLKNRKCFCRSIHLRSGSHITLSLNTKQSSFLFILLKKAEKIKDDVVMWTLVPFVCT